MVPLLGFLAWNEGPECPCLEKERAECPVNTNLPYQMEEQIQPVRFEENKVQFLLCPAHHAGLGPTLLTPSPPLMDFLNPNPLCQWELPSGDLKAKPCTCPFGATPAASLMTSPPAKPATVPQNVPPNAKYFWHLWVVCLVIV